VLIYDSVPLFFGICIRASRRDATYQGTITDTISTSRSQTA
jgi:hypothetical protein